MDLEKARNGLRRAVDKEEKLRATPSITERIREAKARATAEDRPAEDAGDATGEKVPDPDGAAKLAKFDLPLADLTDERKIHLVDRLEKILSAYREADELLPRVAGEGTGE